MNKAERNLYDDIIIIFVKVSEFSNRQLTGKISRPHVPFEMII